MRTGDWELMINANLTYQQNKLLSLGGMYEGNYISAAEYTAIAGLNGAGFHGGNNNIVYQIVGQPLGVFYLPKCTGLKDDGNHKIYNGTALTYMNMNNLPDYNVMEEAPKKMIRDQTATDYWLENGNYLNFDYLTIGWQPKVKDGLWLKGCRLAFTINNLATITGYSGLTPLINSSGIDGTLGVDDKRSYPVSRTYTLSLGLNF